MIFIGLLATAAIMSPIAVDAIGRPVDFGAGTTGAEGGTIAIPTTIAQLRSIAIPLTLTDLVPIRQRKPPSPTGLPNLLIPNLIQNTSGRGPHSGGMKNADVRLHMVNNHFRNVGGEGALMSLSKTSYILAEGNYFQNVAHPVYKYHTGPGPVFTPFDGNAAKICSTYLKRSCVANDQTQSSSKWNYTPADIIVLKKLSTYSSSLINPAAANTVPGTTARNAGVGKVN